MKVFFVFFLISVSHYGWSQDISSVPLIWHVDQMTDMKTSEVFSYQCVFQTNGQQPIQWVQKNGTVSSSLSVKGFSGLWSNVASMGEFVFQVSKDGFSGTVLFERTNSGLFITLDLTPGNPDDIRTRFRVSSITPVN